jgi:hypothetical protein
VSAVAPAKVTVPVLFVVAVVTFVVMFFPAVTFNVPSTPAKAAVVILFVSPLMVAVPAPL